jgi:uncharacterized membrane protein SirB2
VILSIFQSTLLNIKLVKIAPHIIDTLLLLTGLGLVIQGAWLAGDFRWIIMKFIVLSLYIGLGIVAMRGQGLTRGLALIAALSCYGYIIAIAVTKQSFLGGL